jgi:hypothetical protein
LAEEDPDNDMMEFQQDDIGPSREVSPEHLEEQEGDGVDRTIYPIIPITTLDLEEQ